MTIARLPIPKRLTILLLALTALTVPASATIQFSYCSSGCTSTGGSYSGWQSDAAPDNLVFSGSPITFSAGGLSSGIYTDGTGTVFSGYSSDSSSSNLTVSGTSLAIGAGNATWAINIALPANTYAFAMVLSSSSFDNAYAELVNSISSFTGGNANDNVVLSGSGANVFFGFTSDAPITNLVIGNVYSGAPFTIQSFELGAPTPTPEVSSLVSIGTGLILCGFLLRRRRIQKPDRSLA